VRWARELLIAALVIAFVWTALFLRTLPNLARDILFFAVLLLALGMTVACWWAWARSRKTPSVPVWRVFAGLAGAVANTVAFVLPHGTVLYNMAFLSARVALPFPMVDWLAILPICLICSITGIVAGLLAPRASRLVISLTGVIVGTFAMAIPIGVL